MFDTLDTLAQSQKQIDKTENKINNIPMKCSGFSTSAEVFN
jgi:IS30 family transposase